jgi:hypothetical protein
LFENYKVIDFPTTPNIVYVLFFEMNGTEIYFYVGQTSRHIGRFGDYVSRQFTAPTDFRVGEAIKYLQEKKLTVRVKYRECLDSKYEEDDLIRQLSQKFKLLNHLPAYNYQKSTPDVERRKVCKFIDEVLSQYT